MNLRIVFSVSAFCIFLLSTFAYQDQADHSKQEPADQWAPFRALAGNWKGQRTGLGGEATQDVRWEFVMGGKFLQCTTISMSEEDPHQDIGIVSYDKKRERFVYRAFYSEGFVNQFVGKVSQDNKTIEFVTEAIENGPPGLRAKEIIRIDGDQLVQELHLASGDKPYKLCVSAKLRRKKYRRAVEQDSTGQSR